MRHDLEAALAVRLPRRGTVRLDVHSSLLTPRWSKADSNPRSPMGTPFFGGRIAAAIGWFLAVLTSILLVLSGVNGDSASHLHKTAVCVVTRWTGHVAKASAFFKHYADGPN